jgi:hypothetical protein
VEEEVALGFSSCIRGLGKFQVRGGVAELIDRVGWFSSS